MSWFSTGLDKLNQLSESVQKAIPVDKELIAKLTLNTDEMRAERQHIGEEATRKEEVKNMLAGMLPWETKDAERDILVEECKEAILALSQEEATFFGPYQMPSLQVNLEKTNSDDEEDEGEEEEDEEEEAEEAHRHFSPSEESLEKLAKLEPLPPLLSEFDLDSHVGLIQRLLKEDPRLQERQSTLSGGGQREKVFWHNYFFHCAYTRYEAGLSIDEIWSFQTRDQSTSEQVQNSEQEPKKEETVVFDDADSSAQASSENAFVADEAVSAEESESQSASGTASNANTGSPVTDSTVNDFEVIDDGVDGGTGDPELDELEAEIARELED